MLSVPQFELIEWRMTEKYCPITTENELSIVSIIHGESLGSCTGPIQEFGDDGFMIWMVGSIVHLFSIGITFSALWQPISTLHGVGKGLCVQQAKSFHSYELLGPLLPSQQLTYLAFLLAPEYHMETYHLSLLSLSFFVFLSL
ncbi:uncharacterized protein LOC126630656 isoform X2 [Malus sylvestris]|uniref:uncharacterized protein LOC126630656 isoform X2 n=2 Tax=Malus sylvestris TaxID=3752 RepID=UPI0021AC36E1|nr:uncharacterized protein LOC126630656 isoform X2 [Malus sylvestris]